MRITFEATSPDDWDAPATLSPEQCQRRTPPLCTARCSPPAPFVVVALALAPGPWTVALLRVRFGLDQPTIQVLPCLVLQILGQVAAALTLGSSAVHMKQTLHRDGPPHGVLAAACSAAAVFWLVTAALMTIELAAIRAYSCALLCGVAAALHLVLHILLHLTIRSSFNTFSSSGVFAAGRWLSLASTFSSNPFIGVVAELVVAWGAAWYWIYISAAAVAFALAALGTVLLDDMTDRRSLSCALTVLFKGDENESTERAVSSVPAVTDAVLGVGLGMLTGSLVAFGATPGGTSTWVYLGTLLGCVLSCWAVHGEHAKPLLVRAYRIAGAGLVATVVCAVCSPGGQSSSWGSIGKQLLLPVARMSSSMAAASLQGIVHDFHHQSCPRHSTQPQLGTIVLVTAQSSGLVFGTWLDGCGLNLRCRAGMLALGLVSAAAALRTAEMCYDKGFWVGGEARVQWVQEPRVGLDDAVVEGGPRRRHGTAAATAEQV